MMKCAYCSKEATTRDAVGLDACVQHGNAADGYFEWTQGRSPHADTFEYCDDHRDMWKPGCPRCEECSRYHHQMTVREFLESPQSKIVILEVEWKRKE